MLGTLYVVSTPIGNLEDITLRAIRVLKEANLVAAEDTRRTKVLFTRYDISTPLTSYFSYNKLQKTGYLIERLKSGDKVALVSDSGTPGLSDPGEAVVRECVREGIPVVPIPGPSACLAALVASGKPTGSFIFDGFLSNKGAKRKKRLEQLLGADKTVVLYEAPHRVIKFLEDMNSLAPEKEIVLAREMTKVYEEIRRGRAATLLEWFMVNKPRGEFTIIL
ncbi:MAG: 16S rRNA (cytidine(1402)-2'-O)-methyltransferase [Candidatus Omnitrophica bacterium]|nr:16S rRNA (cytidine(1402)-2'-O)-methyltransferase [Candidatus Omnitrophota bacterium]